MKFFYLTNLTYTVLDTFPTLDARVGSIQSLAKFIKDSSWVRKCCRYDIHRLHKQMLTGKRYN